MNDVEYAKTRGLQNFRGRMNGTFKSDFKFDWLETVVANDNYDWYI